VLLNEVKPNSELLTPEEITEMKENGFGLMDGGVTDNQGLECLLLADRRRTSGESSFKPFDFAMVADVTSQYMDPYIVPKLSGGRFGSWLNYKRIRLIFLILMPLIAVTFGLLGWKSEDWRLSALFFGLAGIFFSLAIVFTYLNAQIPNKNTKIAALKDFNPEIISLLRKFLGKTGILVIAHMLQVRLNSVIIMVSDVFLKRIRKLIYDSFYASPQWEGKRKTDHVYDLSFTNDLNRKRSPFTGTFPVNNNIQIVAQKSFKMATTLWFGKDNESNLACLVACGQFTTCYNLREYIWELKNPKARNPNAKDQLKSLPPEYMKRLNDIEKILDSDWAKFLNNPFWLYTQTIQGAPNNINLTVNVNGKDISAQFQIS